MKLRAIPEPAADFPAAPQRGWTGARSARSRPCARFRAHVEGKCALLAKRWEKKRKKEQSNPTKTTIIPTDI